MAGPLTNLNNASGRSCPSPRFLHTAVWTGDEMIIWGGTSGGGASLRSLGRPVQPRGGSVVVDSLTNGTGTRVPTARFSHTAIWTGGEMIVWGGSTWNGAAVTLSTGGRYCSGHRRVGCIRR